MNKHLTNNKKNLLRGITGLAVAGLAGGFMSAGSVSAAELCFEQGPNGLPRSSWTARPSSRSRFPGSVHFPRSTSVATSITTRSSITSTTATTTTDDTSERVDGGVQIPSADDLVDPDRFAPLEPNLDVFEQDNPFLGTDDDAEPELAQPEAQRSRPSPSRSPRFSPRPSPSRSRRSRRSLRSTALMLVSPRSLPKRPLTR
jgi:hypothetical protein